MEHQDKRLVLKEWGCIPREDREGFQTYFEVQETNWNIHPLHCVSLYIWHYGNDKKDWLHIVRD